MFGLSPMARLLQVLRTGLAAIFIGGPSDINQLAQGYSCVTLILMRETRNSSQRGQKIRGKG